MLMCAHRFLPNSNLIAFVILRFCDFVTDLNTSLPFLSTSIETVRKSSDCNQLNELDIVMCAIANGIRIHVIREWNKQIEN